MDTIGNPILKEILEEAPDRSDHTLDHVSVCSELQDGPDMCRTRSTPCQIVGTEVFQDKVSDEKKILRKPKNPRTNKEGTTTIKQIVKINKPVITLGSLPTVHKDTTKVYISDVLKEEVGFMEAPPSEKDQPLYCFACALLPVLASQTQEARSRCLQKIRYKLGYDLDELDKFSEFGYQKQFKKVEMQTSLLGKSPVWKPWLLRYLSDYFGINVITICQDLLVFSSYNKNRATVILQHERRRVSLLTRKDGTSLFDSTTVDKLFAHKKVHLDKLLALSRYKSQEIKTIAEALAINTQKVGKNQARRKDEIYRDVKTVLNWLV